MDHEITGEDCVPIVSFPWFLHILYDTLYTTKRTLEDWLNQAIPHKRIFPAGT